MSFPLAIIGTGKTGSRVLSLLESGEYEIEGLKPSLRSFNDSNPLTMEALSGCKAAIVFVPGQSLVKIAPILLEAKLPVVCGTTGFEYDAHFKSKVATRGTHWVVASNFSPLICALRGALELLGKHPSLLDTQINLQETHHTGKKDAPSGTALSWKDWLGQDMQIQSFREGDVIGEHTLTISTKFENLTIQHSAKSRDLFASGAIRALEHLLRLKNESDFCGGVYTFAELEEKILCLN